MTSLHASANLAIPDEWTFASKSVADGFDGHVREQLPWYDLATQIVVTIGRHHIGRGGVVYDIGAANGNIARALAPLIAARKAKMVSVEAEAEMAKTFHGPGTLVIADATRIEYATSDLIVSFLSLIFVAPRARRAFVDRLKAALSPGGALVIVEKFVPDGGYGSVIAQRMILEQKIAAGASGGAVIDKELSLAGIQRPLARDEIAGFREFFRVGDFAGYCFEQGV